MPRQCRNYTRHPGVYFVELANGDQTFFIRYKKDRKLIEERAGRKNQGWTAAKANRLRTERLAGKSLMNILPVVLTLRGVPTMYEDLIAILKKILLTRHLRKSPILT